MKISKEERRLWRWTCGIGIGTLFVAGLLSAGEGDLVAAFAAFGLCGMIADRAANMELRL